MVDKIAVGESRQSLTSIKQEQKQKKTSELGPEIGVFDISVILKIILCFKFCATSHFFTQKKHFGIHGQIQFYIALNFVMSSIGGKSSLQQEQNPALQQHQRFHFQYPYQFSLLNQIIFRVPNVWDKVCRRSHSYFMRLAWNFQHRRRLENYFHLKNYIWGNFRGVFEANLLVPNHNI